MATSQSRAGRPIPAERKASMSKIRTTTYLPEDLYEQLRKEAYETKTSQAEIIEKALQAYLDQKTKKAGD
jgi:metal-responsive CopG/Arc/MetJ family transcriptional regulator